MTYNMLYRYILDLLKKAGIDSPAFDTLCLFESVFDMNRHNLIMEGDREAPQKDSDRIIKMAEKRASGYPLQYIVGKWEFMNLEFFVGDGVLIPREDTSVVVELCLDSIKERGFKNSAILDLCAGSGAISVALGKYADNSTVTALEISEQAMQYLVKNIQHNSCNNVSAVYGDVFKDDFKFSENEFDVIISNPPYIITDEIKTLQKEVQFEPILALDGGIDGYDFYKKIIFDWSRCLKKGGVMVFELGENQFDTVKEIMLKQGFDNIIESYDIQNIKRGIRGIKC